MSINPVRVLMSMVLILSIALGWMWVEPNGQLRDLAWVAPAMVRPDTKMLPIDLKGGPVNAGANYSVVLDRPIFAPDRRPPPPPSPPKPPPPPDPLADIQIVGVFSGETAGMLARIDGKIRRVKLNDKVGSWTLKKIEGRDITFAQDEQTRKLRLIYARLDTASPKVVKVSSTPLSTSTGLVPGTLAHAQVAAQQSVQDVTRERLRRLNEFRVSEGLPPLENLP